MLSKAFVSLCCQALCKKLKKKSCLKMVCWEDLILSKASRRHTSFIKKIYFSWKTFQILVSWNYLREIVNFGFHSSFETGLRSNIELPMPAFWEKVIFDLNFNPLKKRGFKSKTYLHVIEATSKSRLHIKKPKLSSNLFFLRAPICLTLCSLPSLLINWMAPLGFWHRLVIQILHFCFCLKTNISQP